MVVFDSNHKSIDGDIKEKKAKKILKKAVASGLIVANLLTFSGCNISPTEECNIEEPHAHFYVNGHNGIGRFIQSEKKYVDNLERTDQAVIITDENRDRLDFEQKHKLYRIDQNIEALKEVEKNRPDYIEYEHKEFGWRWLPFSAPRFKHEWDQDPTIGHNYTGQTRLTHHKYSACKVVTNEKGEKELVPSDYADSIFDLYPEYEYIPAYFSITEKIQNGRVVSSKYDMGYKDNAIYELDGMLEEYEYEGETEYTQDGEVTYQSSGK